jgi:hypothetical protein
MEILANTTTVAGRYNMREHSPTSRLVIAITLGMLAGVGPLPGQDSSIRASGPGFPHDWSSQHLVFSSPGSATAQQLAQEPRYLYQALWRNMTRTTPPAAETQNDTIDAKRRAKKDWSENMGSGASVGPLNSPAKYTFVTNTASCSDFVVFNTGLAGALAQPTIVAYTNLYSGCTGSVPTVYWQYSTSFPQGSVTNDGSSATTSVILSG